MVGILDNKNIADLVIERDVDGEYLKINPQTLATVVEDVTGTEAETNKEKISKTVQQHIDNQDIHLTKVDVQQITRNNLEVEDIIAGSNITIERTPDTNQLTISSTDFNNRGFITADDVVPDDDTITITKQGNDRIKIRANIPDTSKMVKQRNIKSGDTGINIEYDEDSNDVYIYGEGNQVKAGDGISIENSVITNTKPDQEVIINAGHNISVEGTYPEFTINSSNVIRVSDWMENINYQLDDMVVYENSLMICIENHTSGGVFEPDKWKLLAGWQARRQYFVIEDDYTNEISLNDAVPNKDVLVINIGGIIQQSQNYDLQPDGQTIRFEEYLPKDSVVEVIVMSNVVMDTYDTDVNIMFWTGNTAYGKDNIVIYDNNIYICLERHISTATFDKSKWQLICGYQKKIYRFDFDKDVTEVTIPEYIPNKNLVEVNVSNTILLSSTYDIDPTGYKILFNKSIEAGLPIEVSVYNTSAIQLPEIPEVDGEINYFLMTDDNGEQYVLRSIAEVLTLTKLDTLLDYAYHPNSIVTVNNQGSGYRFISFNDLAGMVKGGQLIDGLEISSTMNKGVLKVNGGSTLDEEKNVLLTLSTAMLKDATSEWSLGYNRGSSVGTSLDDWTQPIMLSAFTNGYQVFTSDDISDREGWRAMDGKKTEGNGWLVNNKTANFRLQCPQDIVVQGFDFYNTMSGTINHSKEIDVWLGDESNVVASFVAKNEDYGFTHIDIDNDIPYGTVGFTIKSSYGQCVGAKEIQFIARTESPYAKNHSYYVYILGDESGNAYDIATSVYNIQQFANHIPSPYTKYALVGAFNTDGEYNIVDCFPQKQLKQDWIEGSINGTVTNNSISVRLIDENNGIPVTVIEQFDDNAVTNNGRIEFPQAFSKLLWVMANGEKIISKDNNGFTVNSSVTNVSWVAKGYK